MTRHILIVDDEARIREVVQYALVRDGFRVSSASDGEEALRMAETERPDLIVLDVMLPKLDGFSICRKLREDRPVPILFLSARGEEVDRVVGLEVGGDDYLVKPFSVRELVARVRAIMRRVEAQPLASGESEDPAPEPAPAGSPRSKRPAESDHVLRLGPVLVDLERHEVRAGDVPIGLTATEFGVLSALLERPGVVLSRGQLMRRAYSYDNHITERTIDTHVRRIRAKFRKAGIDPIATVFGVGYKAADVADEPG